MTARSLRSKKAKLVVFGALVSVPIVFLNALNDVAALTLVSDATWLAPFDPGQRDALAYLFVRLHARGITVVSIFWGLWLFPFGLLVMRSRFIPKLLGVLLLLAGAGYVAGSFATLVLPDVADRVRAVTGILGFGELPIMVWLAFWGARGPRAGEPVDSIRSIPSIDSIGARAT